MVDKEQLTRHNHLTRDIRAKGKCPAYDEYWERHKNDDEPDRTKNQNSIQG